MTIFIPVAANADGVAIHTDVLAAPMGVTRGYSQGETIRWSVVRLPISAAIEKLNDRA